MRRPFDGVRDLVDMDLQFRNRIICPEITAICCSIIFQFAGQGCTLEQIKCIELIYIVNIAHFTGLHFSKLVRE